MVQPVNVWGSHAPEPEDVFERYERELTEEDVQRRSRKLKPQEGKMVQDVNKFSPKPRMAALYRVDGTLAPVPLEMYQWYLKRRDAEGNRIFYVNPPTEPPMAESDPCPVKFMGKMCGRRMANQHELIKHIQRKHPDEARFYMTQEQIDIALGKKAYMPSEAGISINPSTPPAVVERPTNVVELRVVEEANEQEEVDRAKRKAIAKNPLIDVEEVKVYVSDHENEVVSVHTCKAKGRGKYDSNCPRCLELMARRTGDASLVEGG